MDPSLNPSASSEAKAGGSVTLLQLILNLTALGFGTGMLVLPWGVAGSSVITSLISNALVLALTVWTSMAIVEAGEKYQCFDLGALLEKLPGSRLPTLAVALYNISLILVTLLALISYCIVIYDVLAPLLPSDGFWASRTNLLLSCCLGLVPICFVSQEYLAFSSGGAVLVNFYLLVLILMQFLESGSADEICLFGLSTGGMAYLSAMLYSVALQMCMLPMYAELKDRSPVRFKIALVASNLLWFLCFGIFSVLGYLVYGSEVHSNILIDLPKSTGSDVARIGMLIVVVALFPLCLIPMVAPVKRWAADRAYQSSVVGYQEALLHSPELQDDAEQPNPQTSVHSPNLYTTLDSPQLADIS